MTMNDVSERTGVVTFKGNPMTLRGPELRVGDPAPQFDVTASDMAHVTLDEVLGGGKRGALLISVPSLDTPVCSLESATFNRRLEELPPTVAPWVISMDLPFAMTRWAGSQDREVKLNLLSDYRDHSFGLNYGFLIAELGLLARAIVVVGSDKTVRYVQVVGEVADQPDYDAALKAAAAV